MREYWNQNMGRRDNLRLLVLTLIIVLLLAACAPDAVLPQYSEGDFPAEVLEETEAPGSVDEMVDDAEGMSDDAEEMPGSEDMVDAVDDDDQLDDPARVAYTNEEAGFEVYYPEEWHVTSGGEGITYITSFAMSEAGSGGIPEGETKIDIIVTSPEQAQTMDDIVVEAEQQTADSDTDITSQDTVEVGESIEALRMTFEGAAGETAMQYAVVNGYGVRMVGYGELGPFFDTAESIRNTGQ
jgi:hypothetical protein